MEMLAAADMGWTNFLGDDFSVEDLLVEPEQEEGFDHEAETDSFGTSNQTSSSSAASLEPQHLSMELDFHATEDAAELEWVSRFVDDTFFEFPSESKNHQAGHRCYATPVSSLLSERPVTVPVKARSKRSRTTSNLTWSSSNSCTATNPRNLFEKKKRGRKKKMHCHQYQMVRSERKCGHCGVEKTPQWRAGPMGAKTLCNACGVRFKSGRLLPEYRPACSPTFVSSAHSNSHRKVMEMRRRKAEEEQKQRQ